MVNNFAKIQWTANVETPSNDRVLLLSSDKPKGSHHNFPDRITATTEGTLWFVKLDKGSPPEPLKQRWTKFSTLFQAVKDYYNKKEIQVTEEK